MTEIHEDYGPSYPYSDHKRGDHVSYRLEGHTERGEILWVATGGKLPSGQDMSPHYVVAPDRGGFPDMVLFGDVVMDKIATTILEERDKKSPKIAEIERREHLYHTDLDLRYFKRWLRNNRELSNSDFAKRILEDTRLPHYASRSRYEACLRQYSYTAEDLHLFQEAWKDMLLDQS